MKDKEFRSNALDNYHDYMHDLQEQRPLDGEGADLPSLPPAHPALHALSVLATISKENADNAERKRIELEYGEPF